jgi:hypothetical protein
MATLMSFYPFIRTINEGYHIERLVRVLLFMKQAEGSGVDDGNCEARFF